MRTGKLLNPIGVRLDADLKARAELIATDFGLSLADLIRAALNEQIQTWNRKGVVAFTRKSMGRIS